MRNDNIDALKGFAILSVVIAHSILVTYGTKEIPVLRYCAAYMMPLFIFLSGWVLYYGKSHINVQWVVDKALRLLLPFLCWMPITYIVGTMQDFSPQRKFFDHSGGAIEYILRSILYPGNGLWFLWVLFMLYVIFVLVQPLTRKIGDAAYPVAWVLLSALPSTEIFCIGLLKPLFIYLSLGYLANKHQERLGRFALALQVASVPLFLILGWHWNSGDILGFGLSPSYTISLLGIGSSFLLLRMLRRIPKIYSALIWMGSVSLEVYCIHVSFVFAGVGDGLFRIGSIFIMSLVSIFIFLLLAEFIPLLNRPLFGSTRRVSRFSFLSRLPGKNGLVRQ